MSNSNFVRKLAAIALTTLAFTACGGDGAAPDGAVAPGAGPVLGGGGTAPVSYVTQKFLGDNSAVGRGGAQLFTIKLLKNGSPHAGVGVQFLSSGGYLNSAAGPDQTKTVMTDASGNATVTFYAGTLPATYGLTAAVLNAGAGSQYNSATFSVTVKDYTPASVNLVPSSLLVKADTSGVTTATYSAPGAISLVDALQSPTTAVVAPTSATVTTASIASNGVTSVFGNTCDAAGSDNILMNVIASAATGSTLNSTFQVTSDSAVLANTSQVLPFFINRATLVPGVEKVIASDSHGGLQDVLTSNSVDMKTFKARPVTNTGVSGERIVAGPVAGASANIIYALMTTNGSSGVDLYEINTSTLVNKRLTAFDPTTNLYTNIPRQGIANVGGVIYFSAKPTSAGTKLYKYVPGATSANRVSDLSPGGDDRIFFVGTYDLGTGSKLYFVARPTASGPQNKLFSANSAGTISQVVDLNGSGVSDTVGVCGSMNSKLYCWMKIGGLIKLAVLNGPTFIQVSNTNPGGDDYPNNYMMSAPVTTSDGMYFGARNSSGLDKLFMLTTAETSIKQMSNLSGDTALDFDSNCGRMAAVGNTLYFTAVVAGNYALYSVAGDSNNVTKINGTQGVGEMVNYNGSLVFSGEVNGTSKMKLFLLTGKYMSILGSTSGALTTTDDAYEVTVIGSKLFYPANNAAAAPRLMQMCDQSLTCSVP